MYKERWNWQEDEEEDVSSYSMTLRKREDTEIERASTRSHYLENSLWKRVWRFDKAEYRNN